MDICRRIVFLIIVAVILNLVANAWSDFILLLLVEDMKDEKIKKKLIRVFIYSLIITFVLIIGAIIVIKNCHKGGLFYKYI